MVDCAEAALQIVNGKAILVKEMYCDGLGACLGGCPTGALSVVRKESATFDEAATERHVHVVRGKREEGQGCPASAAFAFSGEPEAFRSFPSAAGSELSNWPVQLKLVAQNAPFLKDADVLLAADCTAFSAGDFHHLAIRGRKVLIACPKLDDARYYAEKLSEIFRENSLKSVLVARMEVPCCGALLHIARQALQASEKDIPCGEIVISVKGDVIRKTGGS